MSRKECIRIVTELASEQDGLVTVKALEAAKVNREAIAGLANDGTIHRVVRGVYLVGLPTLSQCQLWRCALLVGGAKSGLSDRSAFEVRGVLYERPGVASVATARRKVRRFITTDVPMTSGGLGLLKVRRVSKPPPLEAVGDLRATTVPRSLVNLANSNDASILPVAWDQAEFRGLLDAAAIDAELRSTRRCGAPAVRALLDGRPILTDASSNLRSPPELDVLHLIHAAGLPMPEENVPMTIAGRPYVADFYWRLLGLVLELDSPNHLRPSAGVRDRDRDGAFFVHGLDVVRYLDTKVEADPAAFITWLTGVIERQQRRVTA